MEGGVGAAGTFRNVKEGGSPKDRQKLRERVECENMEIYKVCYILYLQYMFNVYIVLYVHYKKLH